MKATLPLGILPAALFFLVALSVPVYAQSNQSGCIAHRPKYIEGVLKDFGQANQYQQAELCGGPFGADSTYCDTVLK